MAQPAASFIDLPLWTGDESGAISRRWMRDMAALLALPAMWTDHTPAEIGAGLLSVLLGMLNLESAYARFDDTAGRPSLECWRPLGPNPPAEFESMLAKAADEGWASIADPLDMSSDEPLQFAVLTLSLPYGNTFVLAAARRNDFPTAVELHLLRVAVSQAVISLSMARRLASERTARATAEAALQRQSEFIATLAGDLEAVLPTLAGRLEQARALASEPAFSGSASISTSQPITQPHLDEQPFTARISPTSPRLSRREAEVLGLLAQGLSNKEIAGVMWLSDRTVERHISSLYRKIGVARRSEATAFALRHGLSESGAKHP